MGSHRDAGAEDDDHADGSGGRGKRVSSEVSIVENEEGIMSAARDKELEEEYSGIRDTIPCPAPSDCDELMWIDRELKRASDQARENDAASAALYNELLQRLQLEEPWRHETMKCWDED